MHAIFAIEPDAINNWKDLRYALEKFGYSKGLLIARYPKTWMRLVLEACHSNGVGDVELKRIEEKLQNAKDDRLVRIRLSYDGGSWLESVSTNAVLSRLSAVLVRDQLVLEKFHRIDDAHEKLFDNRREIRVKRNASELAEAAKYILIASDQLALVDPYFQAKKKCTKVIDSMIRISQEEGCILRDVVIFSDVSKGGGRSAAVERQEYERLLGVWINLGVRITIFRLEGDQLDQDFHARYLFNAKAGLRFDRGFVEPEAHHEREHLTDVVCMDTDIVGELNARFLEGLDCLNLHDEIKLGYS